MPRRAKMKMKRKRRRRRERMEEMAFMRATTRFLRLDQYLTSLISSYCLFLPESKFNCPSALEGNVSREFIW